MPHDNDLDFELIASICSVFSYDGTLGPGSPRSNLVTFYRVPEYVYARSQPWFLVHTVQAQSPYLASYLYWHSFYLDDSVPLW